MRHLWFQKLCYNSAGSATADLFWFNFWVSRQFLTLVKNIYIQSSIQVLYCSCFLANSNERTERSNSDFLSIHFDISYWWELSISLFLYLNTELIMNNKSNIGIAIETSLFNILFLCSFSLVFWTTLRVFSLPVMVKRQRRAKSTLGKMEVNIIHQTSWKIKLTTLNKQFTTLKTKLCDYVFHFQFSECMSYLLLKYCE